MFKVEIKKNENLFNLTGVKKLTHNDQKLISGGYRAGCLEPAFPGSTTMVPVSIAGCGPKPLVKCFLIGDIHVGCDSGTHCTDGECKRYVDDL